MRNIIPSSAKTIFGSLAVLLACSTASARERPACQVKLLRVASEVLEREFPQKGSAAGEISEVVYNYNLPGIPRVIFLTHWASNADEVCFIDVRTTAPADTGEACPDYKFSEIRTTCK